MKIFFIYCLLFFLFSTNGNGRQFTIPLNDSARQRSFDSIKTDNRSISNTGKRFYGGSSYDKNKTAIILTIIGVIILVAVIK